MSHSFILVITVFVYSKLLGCSCSDENLLMHSLSKSLSSYNDTFITSLNVLSRYQAQLVRCVHVCMVFQGLFLSKEKIIKLLLI